MKELRAACDMPCIGQLIVPSHVQIQPGEPLGCFLVRSENPDSPSLTFLVEMAGACLSRIPRSSADAD